MFRRNGQHIAFLRLIAPDAERRHAGFGVGDGAELQRRAAAAGMNQFGQGVGQAARAHVMDAQDRIIRAQRRAAIDHLLTTALHLGVIALHRGKIQRRALAAGRARRRRAAAQPDQHGRSAQRDQFGAGGDRPLFNMRRANHAVAPGQHDGFMIARDQAVRQRLLIAAEIAAERRAAKFVIVARRAERGFEHNRERRGDMFRLAVVFFPGLDKARDLQVGNRKAGQPGLGPRAPPRGRLIAYFPAGTGRGPGPGGNGGRVVMGLDLREDMDLLSAVNISAAVRFDEKARAAIAPHHGGVVMVSGQHMARMGRMGLPDQLKRRMRLCFAVNMPGGVEDLVAAMFRVGLGEHHQFHIGGIAPEFAEHGRQIIQFRRRERQPEFIVGRAQRPNAARCQADIAQRGRFMLCKQGAGGLGIEDGGLGHAVMQQGPEPLAFGGAKARAVGQVKAINPTPFDPPEFAEAAVAEDVGGLAGPGRDRARPRHDDNISGQIVRLAAALRVQQRRQPRVLGLGQLALGLGEIDIMRARGLDFRHGGAQDGEQLFDPKIRQGRAAGQDQHGLGRAQGSGGRGSLWPQARRSLAAVWSRGFGICRLVTNASGADSDPPRPCPTSHQTAPAGAGSRAGR